MFLEFFSILLLNILAIIVALAEMISKILMKDSDVFRNQQYFIDEYFSHYFSPCRNDQ